MSEISLFESSLLSPEVQSQLPSGYTLRALRSNDYERGFLDVLKVLTEVGNHTKEEFKERFEYMKKHNHEYHTITISDDSKNQVVAVGTIFIERKFIRKNGLVGHIEDIAVRGNQQGKKLGLRIIQALKYIGAKRGCYKVILDCSEKNVPFYEKCGFTRKEVEMSWYVPQQQVKARL
ncbi:acyl-CoA N-acyltransferase [Cokeromyces recurvatus]|uniref:acyl-CoA N-acyltransferase n=1 Tax=Cokeromyces recurvatus TaxID=90255 RepID=UPI00221F0421|nr:acyl-CoA N-acyltransferase [Cokeromyces recurvatus]KAI7899402.1 acyl-CoA N-acyltransferase [Cokeromyces recurvatus]